MPFIKRVDIDPTRGTYEDVPVEFERDWEDFNSEDFEKLDDMCFDARRAFESKRRFMPNLVDVQVDYVQLRVLPYDAPETWKRDCPTGVFVDTYPNGCPRRFEMKDAEFVMGRFISMGD
jgi:hypothetical protein